MNHDFNKNDNNKRGNNDDNNNSGSMGTENVSNKSGCRGKI